ncbi:MAG: hypothetical protein ACREBI_06220 [Nitrosotalea sp.]
MDNSVVIPMAKGMNYKKFRESHVEYYVSSEGRMNRTEVIKKLESFLKQQLGEGQDFFDKYEIREER